MWQLNLFLPTTSQLFVCGVAGFKMFFGGTRKMNIRELMLRREVEMKCLNCGKDISQRILHNEIHIHLCDNCRIEFINKKFGRV